MNTAPVGWQQRLTRIHELEYDKPKYVHASSCGNPQFVQTEMPPEAARPENEESIKNEILTFYQCMSCGLKMFLCGPGKRYTFPAEELEK